MYRTQTRDDIALRCCALVLASLALSANPTCGQAIAVPVPIPGLDATGYKVIDQVTRDGGRIVVSIGSGPMTIDTTYSMVLDTQTGATVFDSRPVATSQRPYASVRLSPDGAYLADAANIGLGVVWVRHLATGSESEAYRDAFSDIAVRAVADHTAVIAVRSAMGYAMGIPFGVGGATQPLAHFGSPCHPGAAERCPREPLSMSADGRYLLYLFGGSASGGSPSPSGVMVADVRAMSTQVLDLRHPALATDLWSPDARISGDGRWVGFTGTSVDTNEPRAAMLDRHSGQILVIAPGSGPTVFRDLSDDGRFVLVGGLYSYVTGGEPLRVVDRVSGLVTSIGNPLDARWSQYIYDAHLSGDGSTVVTTLGRPWPLLDFDRGTAIARLDADRDGLHDGWETTFGLDPADASDAGLDPDHDGRTSAQEYDAGTHPLGTPVRYFAEGANGNFFATSLALFNPSDVSVTANIRFLGPDGATASMPITVAAHAPAYLSADQANLPFTEFSIVVESPIPLVAERRMTWDRASAYGSHNGTGVAVPSTTWHFAEGATIARLQTFFLLQNPGDEAATISMRYLLPMGTVQERSHTLPARSRLTVWANKEGAPLDAAEFATTVISDHPIVAERAMYRDGPGETFAAGSVASGVATPATSWFFAEGATGAFFDTYLLLSNPSPQPASVVVQFVRAIDPADPGGTSQPVNRTYAMAPSSRRTIWVAQEDPRLASTQVSAIVNSTIPIVAERTMWWPGPTSESWRESHAETGATAGGYTWAVADIQADGGSGGWDSFLMIASTEPLPAQVKVDISCADGTSLTRTLELPPNRTTLWMRYEFPQIVGTRCGATLTSLLHRVSTSMLFNLYRVPIVVETASYRGDFAAGGAALATRLPDQE